MYIYIHYIYIYTFLQQNTKNEFPGDVGLLSSMDTRGKQLEIRLFNFKQNLSHIFMCNDTIVLQTCRHTHTQTHTLDHRQKHGLWRHVFLVFPSRAAQPRHFEALMIPSVSISVVSTILEQRLWPFNVKGRCERCFLKHQSSDDLPEAVLTVDSHCQYTCKVRAQCQSSISRVAELLTSRHSICASKLRKHPQPCR